MCFKFCKYQFYPKEPDCFVPSERSAGCQEDGLVKTVQLAKHEFSAQDAHKKPDVVAHTCHPNAGEVETGASLVFAGQSN